MMVEAPTEPTQVAAFAALETESGSRSGRECVSIRLAFGSIAAMPHARSGRWTNSAKRDWSSQPTLQGEVCSIVFTALVLHCLFLVCLLE